MDKRTLKALKASVAKWERIVAGTGTCQGPLNCPLCKLFWKPNPGTGGLMPDSCIGCPVYENTGQKGCAGTPYGDYEEDNTQENAEAELAYLRSLLPPKKQPAQTSTDGEAR